MNIAIKLYVAKKEEISYYSQLFSQNSKKNYLQIVTGKYFVFFR